MKSAGLTVGLVSLVVALALPRAQEPAPLRLAIAGLVHGHVSGFLRGAQGRKDVEIVGIFDADAALLRQYGATYQAPRDRALHRSHGDARPRQARRHRLVHQHLRSSRHRRGRGRRAQSHVMMEKPLAVSTAHARASVAPPSRRASRSSSTTRRRGTRVTARSGRSIKEHRAAGDIRKMVAMDGHSGPKEINVQPEFLDWLTDPVRNGAGALFDFGCYGANLMTWMMDNQRPLAVTAMTQQFQPDDLPERGRRSDHPAGVSQGAGHHSGVVELAVQTARISRSTARTVWRLRPAATGLRVALPKEPERSVTLEPLPPDERDSISHLIAVVRGNAKTQRAVVAREQPDCHRDSRGGP